MTAIAVCTRADFAAYLRQHNVIRYDSHQVARDPGRQWAFVRFGTGMIGAAHDWSSLNWMRDRKARYMGGVVEVFFIRWKVDPEK